MIKDKIYKLIVLAIFLLFGAGLFFSAKFLKENITLATNPPSQLQERTSTLNMDAWNKIKHRFE